MYKRKIDENLEITNLCQQLKEERPTESLIQKILAPTNKIERKLIRLEDEINQHKSKLTSYISLSNKLVNQKQEIYPEVYGVSSKRIEEYNYLKQNTIDEIEKTKYLMVCNPHSYL